MNRQKIKKRGYILPILFGGIFLLVGCAPQVQCPEVQCPTCQCPIGTQQANPLVFIYFIDVGQGDATLIKYGETEMLIDCGKNGEDTVSFLKEKNVGDLEYLLITHADSDHLGGCDEVLREFRTHAVITNGQASDTISYRETMVELDTEQHIIAIKGNAWNIGPAEIRVLQANNGLTETNQNSIVTKLIYGNIDTLFNGDCDNECEKLLMDKDVQSEILRVAHHGSKFATEADFLEKVKPQVAIISVGPNSYGHPAQETLDRISQGGVLVYRTDIEGDITVALDGNSYEVS